MTGRNARPDAGPPEQPAVAEAVAHLLGRRAPHHDHRALLGLPPAAPLTREGVIAALHTSLVEIEHHPDASTPDADEARIALHGAAAALIAGLARSAAPMGPAPTSTNPISASPIGRATPAPASGAAQPRLAVAPSTGGNTALLLEADALVIIATAGGWSRRAMLQLARIAHARGATTEAAIAAVQRLIHPGLRPPNAAPTTARAAPARAPSASLAPAAANAFTLEALRADPGVSGHRPAAPTRISLGGVAVLGMLAIFAAAILGILIGPQAGGSRVGSLAPAPGDAPALAAVPADRPGTQADAAAPTPPVAVSRPERNLNDPRALLQEFQACSSRLASGDAAAGGQFATLVDTLADTWTNHPPDAAVALQAAVMECLLRAFTLPTGADAALLAITVHAEPGSAPLPPGRVTREIWGAGMLARLRREPDLPPTVARAVDALLDRRGISESDVAAGFRGGAVAALRDLADLLTADAAPPDADAYARSWRAWLDAASALRRAGEAIDPVALAATDAMARAGFDPARGAGRRAAIGMLTAELAWSADAPARAWLLAALTDPAFSPASLEAVTESIATRTAAPGVDITMVLRPSAGELDRVTLRDRYAAAWDIEVPRVDAGVARLEQAAAEIDAITWPLSAWADLARAACFARLNAAAEHMWRGDADAAESVLLVLADPVRDAFPLRRSPADFPLGNPADQRPAWATAYLAAGSNIEERLRLLGDLDRSAARLPIVDAEVLMDEAVRGSPQRLRELAADIARRRGGDPAVVNALLEQAPRLPRTAWHSRLVSDITIQTLPSFESRAWPEAVRRATVERLLELLAGEVELAVADRIAEIIDDAYRGAAPGPRANAGDDPAAAIAEARAAWSRELSRSAAALAGPEFSIEAIEQRRRARRAVALGPAQVALVEQCALVETMAGVVRAEQPLALDQADAITMTLAASLRAGRSVHEQMLAAERARLALWAIRLAGRTTP